MPLKLKPKPVWPVILFGLVSIPLAWSAQTIPPGAEEDWRKANEAVGQLKRGHADALKWEQANVSPPVIQSQVPVGLKLLTIEDVTRQAWRAHRDMVHPLSRLGTANVTLMATGRWTEIDPRLQRRVDGMDEMLEVAAQARKAWLQAVASRQALTQYRAALDAAEAASELGRRMVNVGNWSKLKQTQVQLVQSAAQMNLLRAQYAADQAQASLIKTLGLRGQYTHVTLPDALPDVPRQLVPIGEWQQQALAIQAQLPDVESMRYQANFDLALAAYQTSHALVKGTRDEVLKVREFISEETVLHYNGMLSSVWDLLDESRNQSQAVIDAIASQRDFWIAETDLQWVLQGGEPDSFVSLGGGSEAAAAAAH
ncbi:TolC family protein [Rhodoferax sp.]|uniref:TolC family protein n=1 Tax=Rhodoferax sp. TaxID=50421 RepID=UPI0025FB2B53|nr:TolC family protein [Rhodoferax sp.]MCM2295643.1 TolC family protein [Rhodoferax sp.]